MKVPHMDGSLLSSELTDLGYWELDPQAPSPSLTRIQGQKPSQLRKEVRQLCPGKPGIYGMVDRHGEVIYIGKAKNLRVRLLSYFRRGSRAPKAGKIIQETGSIVWEVWQSEFVALHRELELIRRWRPRWNVQGQPLRGRLTFLCLGRRPAPYVFLARDPPRSAIAVHGPLPAGPRSMEAVRRLNDLFRLRDCPQAQEMIFPEDGELFPMEESAGCLRLEIGTCLGPCTGNCSRSDYQRQVNSTRAFLGGKDLSPLHDLEKEMTAAAVAENFERAAVLRDKLETLRWLTRRLEWMREAREKMSFIYLVRGWDHVTWWYLIHGGRTLAALPAPATPEEWIQVRQKIEDLYLGKKLPLLLDSYEHVDSLLLVSSWFRKVPGEKKKILTPTKALAMCQRQIQ